MNRLLIILGTTLVVAGLVWPWLKRLPLFHLPGDIIIDRPHFKFFFPITTMLLLSAVISLLGACYFMLFGIVGGICYLFYAPKQHPRWREMQETVRPAHGYPE